MNLAQSIPFLSKNEQTILSLLFKNGAIQRSALTALLPLTQQSIHRLLDGLLQRHFICMNEGKIQGRGKPSPMVSINPAVYASVGLSITTEQAHLCVLDITGQLLYEHRLSEKPNHPQAILAAFKSHLETLQANQLANRKLIGMGFAMQGYREGHKHSYRTPPLLSSWDSTDLTTLCRETIDLPIFTENDATASATAEAYLGHGGKHSSFVYLAFNHGFGAGIFQHGQALIGAHGNAGELSSMFSPEKVGLRPALGGLLKRLQGQAQPYRNIADLVQALDASCPIMNEWVDDVMPQLIHTLLALRAILDPSAIFFGGEAPNALRALLLQQACNRLNWATDSNPRLLVSGIEGDAARFGAPLLPLHHLIYNTSPLVW